MGFLFQSCSDVTCNVFLEETNRALRLDSLNWPVGSVVKLGSQNRMTVDQCLYRLAKCGNIECSINLKSTTNIVGGTLRGELMQEPKRLLTIRKGMLARNSWYDGSNAGLRRIETLYKYLDARSIE